MCNICHREYSSPSFGGPGVCPACDCGVHPDTVRVRELEVALRGAIGLIEAWSNGPLFKNAGVIWPEGGCQAPALIAARACFPAQRNSQP